MMLDPDLCYRIFTARDARYDGRLFVGVTSTGVYCRPVCPARQPKRENCMFFQSAAAAEEAGFRACLRCRPEAAPDLAFWRGTSNTVSRGLKLIAAGALDEDNVETLAGRLGVGERHLRRLFKKHLGAAPVTVAQTRRVLLAKRLLHETRLPMAEVAMASGFGSVRRFNATFQALYARPPRALRRTRASDEPASAGLTLTLAYRPPYDWDAMIAFLAARAVPGVENADRTGYRRTFRIDGAKGTLWVSQTDRDALSVTIVIDQIALLPKVLDRIRHVFDLGAEPAVIAKDLSRDAALAPLVAARPGLRVPGGFDGFEQAVRAILGQQVSVAAARRLLSRLTGRFGEPLGERGPSSERDEEPLNVLFPTPQRLADADIAAIGMPRKRAETVRVAARAALDDPSLFEAHPSLDLAIERLTALQGFGPWTAHYLALRGLKETDAFPASDIALQRAMSAGGKRPDAKTLEARSDAWRPWRAYAAQHLWTADVDPALNKEQAHAA